MSEEKRYNVYGGYNGEIVQALKVTADEVRKRVEDYLATADEGWEIRIEADGRVFSDTLTLADSVKTLRHDD